MLYYLLKKKIINNFSRLKEEIINLEKEIKLMTDEDLKKKFDYFKSEVKKEKKEKKEKVLNKFLTYIFAIIREVIYRKKSISLFPTQILGGIALHYSNIAQMNTGEGKTLTVILPACLNSLMERSIFIVTVNEYLVKRDWELAKPIFDFFQISSGINLRTVPKEEKKKLYEKCRIIYSTSEELNFDYLKNNLVMSDEERIKQDFYVAFIDEVDSTLMDNINPLVISSKISQEKDNDISEEDYRKTSKFAEKLEKDKDYFVDQEEKKLWLSEEGQKKTEDFFGIENIFSFEDESKKCFFLITKSLEAYNFYKLNIDYIVTKERDRIILINSLTGRFSLNSVYRSGVQQSIESKENLIKISKKNKTIATITFQNFFRIFEKLSGMTGTAIDSEKEFREMYGMLVIVINTHKKLIRKDKDDLIFLDKKTKYEAIINLIKNNKKNNMRPILVGSPSVEISEYLSLLLKKESINHYKLNAINDKEEAEIISKAGQLGSITISTNMAGRGTDIILSEESKKAGGLLVIGVERNNSRRIDNQLIGRAGRQGDPGESQFYVSLEDDLIKMPSLGRNIEKFFEKKIYPISGKVFNYLTSEPQKSLDEMHSLSRKNILENDFIIDKKRRIIYNYRKKILKTKNFREIIFLKTKNNNEKLIYPFEKYIKMSLLKEIDNFWSEYLESINRIRNLSWVRIYFPEDPKESFFLETNELFKSGFKKLKIIIRDMIERI